MKPQQPQRPEPAKQPVKQPAASQGPFAQPASDGQPWPASPPREHLAGAGALPSRFTWTHVALVVLLAAVVFLGIDRARRHVRFDTGSRAAVSSLRSSSQGADRAVSRLPQMFQGEAQLRSLAIAGTNGFFKIDVGYVQGGTARQVRLRGNRSQIRRQLQQLPSSVAAQVAASLARSTVSYACW